MRRFLTLALCAALSPSLAEAKNPIPEGEYVVADPLLQASLDIGMIVTVYIHVTSRGDALDIRFITPFRPESQSCEKFKNCNRVDKALELDVTQKDGQVVIENSRDTLKDVIDRADSDRLWIVAPVRIFIDGAAVSIGSDPSLPQAVTLTQRDGRTARLIPASLALTEDAIDFAMSTEMSLRTMKTCIVRQIAQAAARHDRSAADEALLRVVALVGRMRRLNFRWDYTAPPAEDGTDAWREETVGMMLRLATRMPQADAPTAEEPMLNARFEKMFRKQLGKNYDAIYAEAFEGSEDAVQDFRDYYDRMEGIRSNGALAKQLCEDVTLSQ